MHKLLLQEHILAPASSGGPQRTTKKGDAQKWSFGADLDFRWAQCLGSDFLELSILYCNLYVLCDYHCIDECVDSVGPLNKVWVWRHKVCFEDITFWLHPGSETIKEIQRLNGD